MVAFCCDWEILVFGDSKASTGRQSAARIGWKLMRGPAALADISLGSITSITI